MIEKHIYNIVNNTNLLLSAISSLSVFFGVLVAIIAALVARHTNIKNETAKLISKESSDAFLNRTADLHSYRKKDKDDMIAYAHDDMRGNPERMFLLYNLNHYETVCIGIKRGIYSEKIYKDWSRTDLVKDWILLQGFVHKLRDKNRSERSKIFINFENFAQKWAKKNERENILNFRLKNWRPFR